MRSRPGPVRNQRGSALVEMALVSVPLVLLMAVTADLGRAFYTYNTLVKAVRGAARHLAITDPANAAAQAQAQTQAVNMVVYGDITSTGTPQVSGLTASMVQACTPALCPGDHDNVLTPNGNNLDLVSIRVSGYAYTSMFSALLPAQLTFSPIGVTLRQRP